MGVFNQIGAAPSWLPVWVFVVVIAMISKANSQQVTVTQPTPDVYVSQQASLLCSFSLPADLTTVTWYRDVNGTSDVILVYDNTTSTTVTSGTMASRVEGDFSGTSHTLRINTTELEDQQDYFCSVTDVNNATTVNSTILNVLYYENGLELTVEGVSSLTSSSLIRLAPVNITIVCTLPNTRPASDFNLGLFSYADNTTTSLKSNAVVTMLTGDFGVTNKTVTSEVAMTTPGEYDVICEQVFQFMTSSNRSVSMRLTIADSDADPCISSPCQNAGNCSNVTNGFVCACPETHTGLLCETVVPPPALPCASNPCFNGATCRNNLTLNTYECICTECYNGTRCENVSVDPCDANPCSAGFTCVINCPNYGCVCSGTTAQCQTACAVRNPPPPSMEVTYGSTVNLTCDPPPTSPVLIQWFRTGQSTVLGTGSSYLVENVTMSEAGSYTCKVSGACTSMAQTALGIGFDIQPNTTENSSLSLAVGSTHTLTCTVTGQPAPLVYWEWTPADKPTPTLSTASGNDTNNGSDVTTASPVTVAPRQTTRLTSPAASPALLTLTGITSDHEGLYICKANVMNLTDEDIIIKRIEVNVGAVTKKPGTGCCEGKGGMAAWMVAIIVLVIVLILVAVIVAVIILLKKGKEGEGPFVCCFANAVHPDVKDVEKDTKDVPKSPMKYTKTYDDEMELEKKNAYYDNRREERHLVNEDTWSKAPSEDEREEEQDNRYTSREERARTPSPKSLNPIGSRARPLPPLDVSTERRRSRKKKKSRRSKPEREEQEQGSGNESPNDRGYRDHED